VRGDVVSNKAAERTTLLIHLGHVLAPVRTLVNASLPPPSSAYRVLAAQFEPDISRWENKYGQYATVGGVYFRRERDELKFQCGSLIKWIGHCGDITDPADAQSKLREMLAKHEKSFVEFIDKIPVEWEPQLSAAKTPFTTCLMIGDAINGVRRRLDYFDRYLDQDFFHLYLRRLDRSVAVRLVTTSGNAQFGVTSVQALAKAAAQEFASFQLIQTTPADLHDRNLRVDDQVFSVGTSTNSAGKHPTNFTPGDSTPHGHQVLDQIIASGIAVV
jgi:hypothetical protein